MPSGPKQNKFLNRHSVEARQRDEERLMENKRAEQKAKEDAMWQDNDSRNAKKQAKREEEMQKEQERLARERDKREQLQAEERELNCGGPKKVTQRQMQKDITRMLANYNKEQQAMRAGTHGTIYEASKAAKLPKGNVNKNTASSDAVDSVPSIVASGSVGAVLNKLEKAGVPAASGGGSNGAPPGSKCGALADIPDDRHIGKRARVLYKNFYAEHLHAVRQEHPQLRRTQYNDIIWKMWLKDPSNPFVQRSEMRDHTALELNRQWMEGSDADSGDDRETE